MSFWHQRLLHPADNSIARDETKTALIHPAGILNYKEIKLLDPGRARKLCQSTVKRKKILFVGINKLFLLLLLHLLLGSCADHPELLRLLKMQEDYWKALPNYNWAVQWQMRNIGSV